MTLPPEHILEWHDIHSWCGYTDAEMRDTPIFYAIRDSYPFHVRWSDTFEGISQRYWQNGYRG